MTRAPIGFRRGGGAGGRLLVGLQVGLASVVLVAAGLLVRTTANLSFVPTRPVTQKLVIGNREATMSLVYERQQ